VRYGGSTVKGSVLVLTKLRQYPKHLQEKHTCNKSSTNSYLYIVSVQYVSNSTYLTMDDTYIICSLVQPIIHVFTKAKEKF